MGSTNRLVESEELALTRGLYPLCFRVKWMSSKLVRKN